MKLKNLLSATTKRNLQVYRRRINDVFSKFQFAKMQRTMPSFKHQIVITQNILNAETNMGKVENMAMAGRDLSKVLIQPNEVLSFWQIVGNPSKERGFYKSRNLVGGVLQEDYGGGLCQVSGILYLSALSVGLKIIERHSHSVDIYTEEERFTPLGSDATVVYGYKDIRIQNTFDAPIRFHVFVENGQLHCHLQSQIPLTTYELDFKREDLAGKRIVTTRQRRVEQAWQILGKSEYSVNNT